MDKWIQEHLQSQHIVALSPKELEKKVSERTSVIAYGGIISFNTWYDRNVVFDWSSLHRRLKSTDSSKGKRDEARSTHTRKTPSRPWEEDLALHIQELDEYGHKQLVELGEESCMITVFEIDAPWEIQPLDPFACSHTTFSAGVPPSSEKSDSGTPSSAEDSPSSLSTPLRSLQLYSFQRGPPGFQPVVQEVHRFLNSLVMQLREQNIRICRFLNSLVLFEGNFVALMHRTAAVHKAVSSTGLKLHLPRSSFTPAYVVRQRSSPARTEEARTRNSCPTSAEANVCTAPSSPVACGAATGSGTTTRGRDPLISWTSIRLRDIQNEEEVNLFCTDLFFQWLQDAYDWLCIPPIKLFSTLDSFSAAPSPSTAMATDKEEEQRKQSAKEEENSSRKCRISLFSLFFRHIVKPALHTYLGFSALKETLECEGEAAWMEELSDKLKAKRELVGPQKWTALDLRMILCQLGAYGISPVALFSSG